MKASLQQFVILAFTLLLPVISSHAQEGKIGIVAHRGFWQAESAEGAQNSIAALEAAIREGFWGSELDVHLTLDNVVIVNHDGDIQGVKIRNHTFSDFVEMTLGNGEPVPTLPEYLKAAKKGKKCMIVLEIKDQGDYDRNILLSELAIQELKKQKIYKPSRVMFISFSLDVCEHIGRTAPEFTNQYLGGDKSPAELKGMGINGLDYNLKKLRKNPQWVAEAHALGMSVNCWTVDDPEDMQEMMDLGVDCISTNKPTVLRRLLGARELKN